MILQTYLDGKGKGLDPHSVDTDLRSKIVLLTLSFPKLRTIWSSSPFNTVEIFRDLKENRSEPIPEHAVLAGADDLAGGGLIGPDGERIGGGMGGENGFNTTSQDMLRALPGISTKNYRYVMSRVASVEALCDLELKAVQELVGNDPGKLLHGFIHRDITVRDMDD